MEGLELVCNSKHCKTLLTTIAWVTSCSHAFCETHGKEICNSFTCPACGTVLSDKMDCVKADLKPSDKYKSMVLAGHGPEVVMDIANRALLFWQYQMMQEQQIQKATIQCANDNLSQAEKYYEDIICKMQIDLDKAVAARKALETELARKSLLIEKLQRELIERQREYRELQIINNKLRLRCSRTENNQRAWSPKRRHSVGPEMAEGSTHRDMTENKCHIRHSTPRTNPHAFHKNEGFAFQPVTPTEQLQQGQRRSAHHHHHHHNHALF